MALKTFWIYTGSFFLCALLIIILVKTYAPGFVLSGRKPFFYAFFAVLISALAVHLLSYSTENSFAVFWFTGGFFLLFGAVHTAYIKRNYLNLYGRRIKNGFGGEIFFGLAIIFFVIVIFSVLQYFVKDRKDYLFYPMLLSTLVFFVPILVVKTFESAFDIPAAIQHTWQYPLQQEIDYPEENEEKLLVVFYHIAKRPTDYTKVSFIGKAPPSMKFGEAYYHFLNDYNDTQEDASIQYADSDFEPHEWWFYKKVKWYQRQQVLDPNLSVRENGIRQNTVIVCERVQHFTQEHK